MLALMTLWSYVKKYCGILVAVAAFVVLLVFKMESTAQVNKLLNDLAENDKKHREELQQIQAAHDAEDADHEAHLKQLQDTLDEVERQYTAAKQQLDDSKRAEIKQIIEEYNDNPDELAKRLSDATGIQIDVSK